MNILPIKEYLIAGLIGMILGAAVTVYVIGGGAQTSRQDASYDQKLDNINNSVVELKNVMFTNSQKINSLINFSRVIVKDNPRLKSSGADKAFAVRVEELFDSEPEVSGSKENEQ